MHLVKGAVYWPVSQAGAPERNKAIEYMVRSGKQDWKDKSRYHQRFLAQNLMCRFKTLIGHRLRARDVHVQDAEIALKMGIINRMRALARPKSVRMAQHAG